MERANTSFFILPCCQGHTTQSSPVGHLFMNCWKSFPLIKGEPRAERSSLLFTVILESICDAGSCFCCLVIMKRNITVLKKAENAFRVLFDTSQYFCRFKLCVLLLEARDTELTLE